MRVYLALFFLIFFISYCVPRKGGFSGEVTTIGGSPVSSDPRSDRAFCEENPRTQFCICRDDPDDSSCEDNTIVSSRDRTFCEDNPNTQYCICLDNPRNSSCLNNNDDDDGDDDDGSSSDNENFQERHRELLNRFEGYVNLDDVDEDNVEDFLAGKSLNSNLRQARVYLDLKREVTVQPDTYGGEVQILFETSNRDTEIRDLNRNSLRHSSGDGEDVRFNAWYGNFKNNRGRLGYHGFFEDRKYGSIILSINKICRWGGESGDFSGEGSIWYMRFKSYTDSNHRNCYRGGSYLGDGRGPSHPNRACWFLEEGPYSCTAWTIGGEVHPVSGERGIEPTSSCYKKLGSFDNLDIKEVFNLDGNEQFLRTVTDLCGR